jgi:hypothetical protein
MPRAELLLRVAAEGGSIAIYGRAEGSRNQYRVGIVDQTLTFLDDEEGGAAIRSDSGWLNTWEEAITRIGRWPWPNLYPKFVHPSIRDALLKAVQDYRDRSGRGVREEALRRWQDTCTESEAGSSP